MIMEFIDIILKISLTLLAVIMVTMAGIMIFIVLREAIRENRRHKH